MAIAGEPETTEAGNTPTPTPAPVSTAQRLIRYLVNFALGGSILVVLYAFVMLTLARYDMIEKIDGFRNFMQTMMPALVLAVLALIALILVVWRKAGGRFRLKAVVALLLSGALPLVMYTQVMLPAGKVPPIHDVTTDVDDPPQFTTLDQPEISTGIDFSTGEPVTVETWRAFHTQAYADIQPILIDKDPAQVLGDIQALMEDRGWDVAHSDPATGHIEGTAYAGYLRFRDDVVVEVTPVADGSSRVDMRSVSRVGQSDLGYNAARIREFLADLQAID